MGNGAVPLVATLTSPVQCTVREIIWGTVSDRLGRERTMFLTLAWKRSWFIWSPKIAGTPMAFVALFSFIFLFWGEIYSLFSANDWRYFRPKNASANYGMWYTAKGRGVGVRRIPGGSDGSILRRIIFRAFYISAYCVRSAALVLVADSEALSQAELRKKPAVRKEERFSEALAQGLGCHDAGGKASGGHFP